MKKIKNALTAGLAAVLALSLAACGGQVKPEGEETVKNTNIQANTETEKNTSSTADTSVVEGTALSESDLPGAPEYGANPEYAKWSTVPYEVVDAGQSFIATVSANEELTEFEVLCKFFDDQKAIISYDGENMNIVSDRTGFMKDFGPDIVALALEQNLWLPTSECSVAYVDPAANDHLPPYLRAGVWEDEFERTNANLNGLPSSVDDETVNAYKQPCDVKGSVVPIEYDTYFYAKDAAEGDINSHATPVTKTAYVYLPAGYDETKQYNVFYLLHGGGDTAESWFSQFDEEYLDLGSGAAVNILDNLFANGDAEPCIVVTPGMYDVEGFDDNPAAGAVAPESFAMELNDLIAAVESTYSTYAADTSRESLIASRDHRALAGLSMGSITTWKSGVVQSLDIISWIGNMSAGPSADLAEAQAYTTENIIPAIDEAAANGYTINMLLSCDGINDMALEPHVATHKLLVEYAENSDVLTVGENYDFIVSDGSHGWNAWNLYLYDMMKVFFK